MRINRVRAIACYCRACGHVFFTTDPAVHPQEPFGVGYRELIRRDRRLGGVVYDAVRQLAEFVQLVASQKNIQLMQDLRNSDCVGIARNGDGIRMSRNIGRLGIRNSLSQFRSLDGGFLGAAA